MELNLNMGYTLTGRRPLHPVEEIKQKIARELGIPIERQILFVYPTILLNEETVGLNPLSGDFTVQLIVRPPQEMFVPLRPSITILDIKNQLCRKFCLPISMLVILNQQEEELLDMFTLQHYAIDNLSWLHIFLRDIQASYGPPFALIQGTLEAQGTPFTKIPTEACPLIQRGSVAWVGSGPEFFISLANHEEWKKTYTVFGSVLPEDMEIAEKIAQLPAKGDIWNNINVSVLEKPVHLRMQRIKTAAQEV